MRSTMLFVIAGAALASTTTAHADQCAMNAPPTAAKAATLVPQGSFVLDFCEPCHDKAPGKSYRVSSVDVKGGRVTINGTEVDLAYLYVETSPGEFRNVGVASGCGASDVSEKIVNGKPSGPIARPAGPRRPLPPLPPPPPRITGIDDLAGRWNVRITTRMSTCASVPLGVDQARWVTSIDAGVLELETAAGTRLTGAVTAEKTMNKVTLKPIPRTSASALQLTQFSKDMFFGTLVRAERGSTPRDPVCVVQQEVSARRE